MAEIVAGVVSTKLAKVIKDLESILSQLDVALSSRASESTLSGIKSQTDKLTFDSDNRLAIQNPPNLDVLLSSRASESTLSAIKAALASVGTDKLRATIVDAIPQSPITIATDNVGLAKDSTVSAIKNALASVGTDKLRATVVDALPESPFNITKVAGTALTGRDWSSDLAKLQNLDVALSVLSTLIRWGRNAAPSWVHAAEVSVPAAGTALVSRTVSSGKVGFIYGFYIMASEANDFLINWTSGGASKSMRIKFTGAGSLQYVDFIPLNEGLPADGGSSITITNVNAGSSGSVYQARLLYVEV